MKLSSFLYEFVFIRTCRPGSVLLLNISKKEKEYTAMNEVLEKIQKTGIVPVVVLDDARDAAPLARALCEGGLPCAEVTFRTEAAEESIRIMTAEYPQMLVGAGTVLTPGQADRAVGAGAQFIVSPGLNPAVVTHCLKKGITVIPGVCTPSEVETAIALGLSVCIANEEDAADVFGIRASGTNVTAGTVNHESYREVAQQLAGRFGFSKVAITLRESVSANDNLWSAMLYDGSDFYFSRKYPIHIVDRVGGGDSFGAGLIYACLSGYGPQDTVEFAVAASCLKHSIEGDMNMVSVDEVVKLAGGDASGRVQR